MGGAVEVVKVLVARHIEDDFVLGQEGHDVQQGLNVPTRANHVAHEHDHAHVDALDGAADAGLLPAQGRAVQVAHEQDAPLLKVGGQIGHGHGDALKRHVVRYAVADGEEPQRKRKQQKKQRQQRFAQPVTALILHKDVGFPLRHAPLPPSVFRFYYNGSRKVLQAFETKVLQKNCEM